MELITFVAGAQFYKLCAINDLKPGDILQLVPEKNNKYDPFAVQIQVADQQIGYVPAVHSREVTLTMAEGLTVECEVLQVSPEAKVKERCKIRLYAKE